jgi:hypothetical protein
MCNANTGQGAMHAEAKLQEMRAQRIKDGQVGDEKEWPGYEVRREA